MTRVQFHLTDDEAAFFTEYAKRKGLLLHTLAKTALFQFTASHRFKDLNADNYPKNGRKRDHGPSRASPGTPGAV